MSTDDRTLWEAASPVMIGAELVRTVGETRFYRLDAAQVLLRKRHVSDQTRQVPTRNSETAPAGCGESDAARQNSVV